MPCATDAAAVARLYGCLISVGCAEGRRGKGTEGEDEAAPSRHLWHLRGAARGKKHCFLFLRQEKEHIRHGSGVFGPPWYVEFYGMCPPAQNRTLEWSFGNTRQLHGVPPGWSNSVSGVLATYGNVLELYYIVFHCIYVPASRGETSILCVCALAFGLYFAGLFASILESLLC